MHKLNRFRKEITIIFVCILFPMGQSKAQTVKIDGEIRSRTGFRDGFQKPLADSLHSAVVNELRTRVNIFYSDKKVSAKITFQDSRIYGETGVNNTNNSAGLYEAWGAYAFNPNLSLSLGRQSLEYDDKRLLSASNWSSTGNAHDLALLKYVKGDFQIHFGSAWNNASDVLYESPYSVIKSYKSMNYIWLAHPIGIFNLSALWLNDAFQRGTTSQSVNKCSYRNTMGGNLELNKKEIPLYLYATAYYQFGHDPLAKNLEAALLALRLKYNFVETLSATLGADHFSGSKNNLSSGQDRTFNKLYGANHPFNGSMEYWVTLPTQGLNDIYGGLTLSPNKKFSIDATYHSFSLDKQLSQTSKKSLGSEIDLTAYFNISKEFTVQGGWSAYFKTHTTSIVKSLTRVDTQFPMWAYLMISFKPTFFSKN